MKSHRPPATVKRDALAARRARTEKPCSKCGVVKPLAAFSTTRKRTDGVVSECKECVSTRRALMLQDPAKRAHVRALRREWWLRNPEANARYSKNYEARKKANGGSHTRAEWKALCAHHGNICLCCGEAKPLTVDHVVPISKGGRDDIENIQPLCRSCNNRKRNQHIDYR